MSEMTAAVFSWGDPMTLLWLWGLVPMIALGWWSVRRWNARWAALCDASARERLISGPRVGPWRRVLVMAGVFALIVVALARPRLGYEWREVKRRGIDLVIAVDVSSSMLAQDVSPSRIERARRKIADLLGLMSGDRVGLVAFAGQAFVHCPLTVDYGAIRLFLDDLGPDLVSSPGTSLSEAIRVSLGALRQGGESASRGRGVLLITDGEDHGGDVDAAVSEARSQGTRVDVVAVGDPTGAPIPEEGGGFKKDSSGNVVLTKADEASLRRVAEGTGGVFVRSAPGDVDLEAVYTNGIKASTEDSELDATREKLWHERFVWPALAALLLLVWDAWMGSRRVVWRLARRALWRRGATGGDALALLLVSVVGISVAGWTKIAFAADAVSLRQAHKAYDKKDYETALKGFSAAVNEDPADLANVYNEAVTQYQLGKYREASEGFTQSMGSSDPTIRQRSLYNLGNAQVGMDQLKEAAATYEKALQLDPKDEDARANWEWVKARIEEQKRQESSGNDKDKDKDNDKDKNQDENKSQSSDPKNGQQAGDQSKQGQDQKQDASKGDQANQQDKASQQNQQGTRGDERRLSKDQAEALLRQLDESAQRRRYGKPDGRSRDGKGGAPGGADW